MTESLRLSRATGARIGVARGLESFAALAVREGEAERAVLLAAASTALREAGGLPPLSGARAERYVAPARGLGEQAIARLWARGLAMSAEAAIELALGQSAAPPEVAADAAAIAPPSSLTARELEIAVLIARGRSNKAIAEELVISPATVARHVANIMNKLGFRSRAQIAVWTADRGLVLSARLPLGAGLLDGQLRRRVGFQPFIGDRLAADHGPAVGPGLKPGQGPVDRGEPLPQVLGHGVLIAQLVQRQGRVPVVTNPLYSWFGEGFLLFLFDLLQQ